MNEAVLDLSGGWGGVNLPSVKSKSNQKYLLRNDIKTISGASRLPKFVLNPEIIVKINLKYIADPPLVSHKSSTGTKTARPHSHMSSIRTT